MTRPAAETTQSSFTVPRQGEAARVQVSTAVGNSAGAPIHTPPCAAKADPNAMRLPTSEEQPPEPYCYPSLNLFNATRPDDEAGAAREMKKNADILVNTLDSFGVKTTMLDICRGPSVTRYELQPQAGIKVSRITSLADDIALNLATAGVRIEAPIPGKPAVGIEVPNKIRSTVNIRAVFESQNYINMRSPLTMALGKDIAGTAQVADLCKMPHLLIAGSTGSGKSVCVNSIIISFLFRSGPEDVKLILIDPKVVELAEYNGIPHLLMPVVTEPRKAAGALGASVAEMERRYKLFAENNVREIKAYNKLAAQTGMEHLPYIAIVIDELADLMVVDAVHNLPHMGIADGIGSFGGKQLCFAVERVHVGRYLNILAVGAVYHAECVIFKCIRSHVSSPFPYLSFIQQYTKNGLLIQCRANRNPRRQSTVALAAGIPVSKPTPQKRRRRRQMRYPQGGQGRNVRDVLPT